MKFRILEYLKQAYINVVYAIYKQNVHYET